MPTPRVPPPLEDEVTLARYPFLPQASPWIQQMAGQHQIDLDELLEGQWMEKSRQRARLRLVDSLESKEGVTVVGGDIFTVEGRLTEAFSFYYARLVACSSEDERFVARWAQAEAERAERILTSDKDNLERIARTYISEISKTIEAGPTATRPGLRFNQKSARQIQDGLLWKIGLSDYIEICPKITGSRWRLSNCKVVNGQVILFNEQQYSSSAKLARLLREKIKRDIEQEALKKMNDITTDLAVRLAEPVGMIRNLMANKASEAIALVGADENDWPPCMRKIVAELENGVNVNHFGRLFLASMSATLALPKESCVGFFNGAPDFDESTTTYQVNHIYEHAYTPSGCGKLKLNHNCPVLPGDDRLCDISWMDHPLKYIRATQRWKAKNQQVEQTTRQDDEPISGETSVDSTQNNPVESNGNNENN